MSTSERMRPGRSSAQARYLPSAAALLMAALLLPAVAATADERHPGAIPDKRVATGTGTISEAWLADPTTRYRHFVLGSKYEAGSLHARMKDGRTVRIVLPETSVFEDRMPRIADLDGDGQDEIVVVRSHHDRGAALAVLRPAGNQLRIVAETPPTGRPNTWINPAAIADLDGDGSLDIAYVQMPHVLGRLRVWTMRNGLLVEIASMADTSNHAYGSPHIALAATIDVDGDGVLDLAIPSLDRRTLRLLSFKGGAREIARLPLPGAAKTGVSARRTDTGIAFQVGLADGRMVEVPLRRK